MGKYFPETARHAKAQEFLELKQGATTVMDYVARFTELAQFADDYVATDLAKVMRFENGLNLSIHARIVGLRLQDMDSMVGTALTIEREIEDARSTRDAGVSSKRKDSQSSSSSGKRQRASSSRGSQSHSHPGQGQMRVSGQAGQMVCYCDALKLGGPLTTRQLAEYKWMSGYPTPLQKIGQSLLCTGSSTQIHHLHKLVPTSITLLQTAS